MHEDRVCGEQPVRQHNPVVRLGDARRQPAERRHHDLVCQVCGDQFRSTRSTARACSDRCRARIRYWVSQGAVRLRVRAKMLRDQVAEMERIAALIFVASGGASE